MRPKTIYGWYNKLVRGHAYNPKTAYILDHSFKPSKRLLSTLEDRTPKADSPAYAIKKSSLVAVPADGSI